jgi:hypothetical protein
MQLIMDKGTIDRSMPNDCHMIWNDKASFVYWFEDGAHVSRPLLGPWGQDIDKSGTACCDWQPPRPF